MDEPNSECVVCGRPLVRFDSYKGSSQPNIVTNNCCKGGGCRSRLYRIRDRNNMIQLFIQKGDPELISDLNFRELKDYGYEVKIVISERKSNYKYKKVIDLPLPRKK